MHNILGTTQAHVPSRHMVGQRHELAAAFVTLLYAAVCRRYAVAA